MPDSARLAITRAVELGHILVLCTGRSRLEIYPWLWELGFTGLVGANGAYAEVGGEVIRNTSLSQEEVEEITSWLRELDAYWFWQAPDGLYQSPGFVETFTKGGVNGSEAGDWSAFASQVLPFVRTGVPERAAKLTFIIPSDKGIGLAEARAHFGERYTIVDGSVSSEVGYTGELSDGGVDKSVGLRAVCEHFGVPVSEAIAIGDSANDVEMLRAAGISVAMGNGTEEAKATATFVTTSIDDDGLAQAFEKLGLLHG